jgi:predicted metal-dependent hydrolase
LIKPDVLIKSKRKSLSLTVNNDGKLIVHAPKKMALEEIFAFIEKKQDWIKQKKQKVFSILQINKKVMNYEQMLFLGKLYDIVKVKGIKEAFLEGNYLCIPDYIKEEKVPNSLKNWLQGMAEEVILDRLDYFAELMDLDFDSVKIVNSRAKWGSCDARLNLTFNFKMVMLPPILIDYIVIHELAHILELNHSSQFWQVVASIMPSYKKHRETLKNSGFLLNLFLGKSKKKKVDY